MNISVACSVCVPYSRKNWQGFQFGDFAVCGKIAKLNSTNIKPPQSMLAGQPLEYIRLYCTSTRRYILSR